VRRPWRPVLADVVPLDRVWRELDHEALVAGRDVVIGMLDSPESQEQRPSVIDLEASGGLLVFGTGGSGKTTLLRSIITGVERLGSGAATIVFDFASRGLAPLRELPSVIDVATGDDLEAVTRHLLVLDMELERRRSLLARVSADTLSACRADAGPPIERIVVVIDGFGSLAATLFDVAGSRGAVAGGERWTDIVHRLVTVGRQCGIHTVMASDRRAAVPARVQSAIGARLVLRHADPQSYADLGVRADAAATIESTAGRALLDGSTTVQIAIVGVDASARGQMDAIGDVANSSLSGPTGVLASEALPESVARPVPGAIGIADITGDPVAVDLEFSHAAIVGPPRSGRSSAVAAFAAAIGGEVYLIGPAGSGLAGRGVARRDREAFGPVDVVGAMLDRLASRLLAGSAAGRVIVCVDDLDRLDDPLLESVWQRLLTCGDVRLVASVESRAMSGYTTDPALAEVRRARRLLVLQPDDPSEFLQLTGLVLPSRPGLRWPPGRGVLVDGRVPTVVQVSGLVHGHRAPHDFAVVGPDS
jgi:S-DNA-T family DNA segregation ATPase FtsK/SpoIIIE